MRALVLLLTAAGLISVAQAVESGGQQIARGVVFNDADGDGVRDAGEEGISGVRVSNGLDVVTTDSRGAYEVPVDDDTIVFVVKPTGWMTATNRANLPRFFYIHKPAGSPDLEYAGVAPTGPLPESIDFPLHKQDEPRRFHVTFFGDTQPYEIKEIDYLAHDIIEEVIGTDAAFGISLGDLVGNRLSLYGPLTDVIRLIDKPWYNVIGNHDMNFDAPNDKYSDETFERVFGPSYYSFDYGGVHFVMLDDPYWFTPEGEQEPRYEARLGPRQMQWLRNDVALVPEDRLIVVCMHIPIFEIQDRQELFGILEDHPHTFSVAAHWHMQEQRFLGKADGWRGRGDHHHLIAGTTSGSWWHGEKDEVGIPHTMMRDGTPNGWLLATFKGTDYSVRFKAARRPWDYQMNIHAPDAVKAAEASEAEVVANVFLGSPRTTVEMQIDKSPERIRMEHVSRSDPYYAALKAAEEQHPEDDGPKLPEIRHSSHIWTANLPAGLEPGAHLITVRATDVFGREYTGRRIIRIE
jgi:hypothetical protein